MLGEGRKILGIVYVGYYTWQSRLDIHLAGIAVFEDCLFTRARQILCRVKNMCSAGVVIQVSFVASLLGQTLLVYCQLAASALLKRCWCFRVECFPWCTTLAVFVSPKRR